ncbi:MAG: hypothetical protein US50_C0003G0023, partial [Candidatus Nomurabacteria bacterium GW2011_GWB1_37_5]
MVPWVMTGGAGGGSGQTPTGVYKPSKYMV